MKKINAIPIVLLLILFSIPALTIAQAHKKLRLLVLSDIETDPDDTQSLIRFLTYCNQWDVEGLIATTSIHQQKRVAPKSIVKVLDAYKKVQPNWRPYEDVNSYAGKLKYKMQGNKEASFKIPAVAKTGEAIHTILEVTDVGTFIKQSIKD